MRFSLSNFSLSNSPESFMPLLVSLSFKQGFFLLDFKVCLFIIRLKLYLCGCRRDHLYLPTAFFSLICFLYVTLFQFFQAPSDGLLYVQVIIIHVMLFLGSFLGLWLHYLIGLLDWKWQINGVRAILLLLNFRRFLAISIFCINLRVLIIFLLWNIGIFDVLALLELLYLLVIDNVAFILIFLASYQNLVAGIHSFDKLLIFE